MKEIRINQYWSDYFGIVTEELNSAGISAVAHKSLEGYNGAWLFIRGKRIIISVLPDDLLAIKEKVEVQQPSVDELFQDQYIQYLFGSRVEKIIGPVYQGYYDSIDADYLPSEHIKQISFKRNIEEINAIANSGDETGWKNSSIDKDRSTIYGYYLDGKIVSIANYKIVKGDVGFLGIYTSPEYRGKGYGQQTIRKAISDLSQKDKLVLYQTLVSNLPSIGIARKLGIQEFGRNLAIRLK